MDIEDLYRPLLRSASMRERHKPRFDRACGKRQSHSLDRDLRNSFTAAFDEYIYYDSGFRRFKGVSSLLVQSFLKNEDNFEDIVYDKLDNDKGKSARSSVDRYNNVDRIFGSDREENMKHVAVMSDETICVKECNPSSVEAADTKCVNSVNQHKISRSVLRCLSLYERERKPHYCSNNMPPEQKSLPSAWSFERKGNGSLAEGSRRKLPRKLYSNATCETKDTASDNALVTPRKVSPKVFGETKDNKHDKTFVGENSLENRTFQSSVRRNVTCRPSQIPRPIRTLSFSGKNAEIGEQALETESGSPRMMLRRSISLIDKRDVYITRLAQSAPTSPRSGDLTKLGSPTTGRLSVDSPTQCQISCISNEGKLVCTYILRFLVKYAGAVEKVDLSLYIWTLKMLERPTYKFGIFIIQCNFPFPIKQR